MSCTGVTQAGYVKYRCEKKIGHVIYMCGTKVGHVIYRFDIKAGQNIYSEIKRYDMSYTCVTQR